MRPLIALLMLVVGCATTPSEVYDLADAPTDLDRAVAAREAAALLVDRYTAQPVRMAAAQTLGRLRVTDTEVVGQMRQTLFDDSSSKSVRAFTAWALGELRSGPSLVVLTEALRRPLDPLTTEHVLQGLAKHYAVMSTDHETLVEIVEALVFFAGNHAGGALPATYDLLSANTRTLPVNVEVLRRAVQHVEANTSAAERAAMYNAAYELLSRLESNTSEIVAGASAWEGRVRSAVEASLLTLDTNDPQTALLVVWYLGRLASVPEVARPTAKQLLARTHAPTKSERASQRLVAAWALARMQVHALGPRRTLLLDILSKELEPEVLDLIGDISHRDGSFDVMQKILGVGAAP